MDVDEWLTRFERAAGVTTLSRDDLDVILEIAAVAAHASERKAAPLTCWLAAAAGLSPHEALKLSQRLAAPDSP